jgi:hypothetical protein
MKSKKVLYVAVFLFFVIFSLSIYMHFTTINTPVPESSVKNLEMQQKQNAVKLDSIELLKEKKTNLIGEKQKDLYEDIMKAKQNNTYYEKLKENIGNTNDADSLARLLTGRYTER